VEKEEDAARKEEASKEKSKIQIAQSTLETGEV